jgi:hypothetical protein
VLADLLGAGGDDHLPRRYVLARLELDADDARAVTVSLRQASFWQ